mmetsp:Transcript_16562/g.24912  ORF Transcript_16562/g.24912 Transcript_16562/m.24912 type:complete len:624 (+) Transcript_16562:220-2091(+)|eukprot:CAMPEP_0185040912 /NCGR_PEP_ID=MMETSP1103-20130426/39568_1 /TAXON_ID=36769 /ORGANISM="Paraphysomonas bandaiensis, Strain Caron Lab Isolate" /LENGTH=623 /DNA_ID=CAMNT_0027580427 /DNA_START=142 /DNA_END=2013 /DNA_ORIENTATION=-
MSRSFTLQQNEDPYFKHTATAEKNGPLGTLYVTSLRFAWIPNDDSLPNFVVSWAEVSADQYKSGTGKQKHCAIRLTTISASSSPKEFYLGESAPAIQRELESLRSAVKRARQGTEQASNRGNLTVGSSQSAPQNRKLQAVISQASHEHTESQRKALLLESDKELRGLYDELVKGGIIDESEFWSSHTNVLSEAEARSAPTQRGMITSLLSESVDMSHVMSKNGEKKSFKITPHIVAEIFATNPIVKKQYDSLVPHELTEAEFWQKYFLSEYFTRTQTQRDTSGLRNRYNSRDSVRGAMLTDDLFTRAYNEDLVKSRKNGPIPARKLSQSVSVDTDLTSIYGDYHIKEPLDPEDFTLPQEKSAILDKYVKKSTAVLDSQQVGISFSLSEGANDNAGQRRRCKRPGADWGPNEQMELKKDGEGEYIPLKLKHAKRYNAAPIALEKMEYTPPTAEHVLRTLDQIFPPYDYAMRAMAQDIQSMHDLTQVATDAARRATTSQNTQSSIGGTAVITVDHSRTVSEVMEVPPGFQQFMLEQFTAITELLRHFYSNINYHGMKQESKVGKIQAKLEERLTLLTNKKRDLQNNHSAEAGELKNCFRVIKEVSDLVHSAFQYWDVYRKASGDK